MKSRVLFAGLGGLSLTCIPSLLYAQPDDNAIDPGHTAWVMASAALVLLMTPGLALFYAGMVRAKNVLGTMMHSIFCMGLVTVQWVLFGYSIAFGSDVGGGLMGNPTTHLFLKDVPFDQVFPGTGIPVALFMVFQMMFAIITPALISGAFAERIKFLPFCVFTFLWATVVYDPVCHWVWGGGWLSGDDTNSLVKAWFGHEAKDFAGGTVVHISSGISAFVLAILIGKRKGYPEARMSPHNLVYTVLGAGLLWFGWFGFNAGSALAADSLAVQAFVVTHICAAAAAFAWALIEWFHRGKASILGVATGLVAGLVCITPAAGFVGPMAALIMGLIVSVVCYIFVAVLKAMMGYDDSLDAFGVHGVGGTVGALLTGVFCASAGTDQFLAQLVGVVFTMVWAVVWTVILYFAINAVLGFRVTEDDEETGLDLSQHGEVGLNL